jgi:hypothetical protein
MRRLFRSFERFGLDYLLISGQAAILYGGATFSEDVDIWIRPTLENATRLLRALAACQGRVYKLTPPLSRKNLTAGHGFHFVIPARPTPVYLDVMGRPPRVGPYRQARRRAHDFRTPWGRIPVVSIPDLIALKRTRRLSDYEVISNLVPIHLAAEGEPTPELWRWAYRNSYRVEDRLEIGRRIGVRPSQAILRRQILAEVARLQAQDTVYWRGIIADLRHLRRAHRLLAEGTPVARLLRTRRVQIRSGGSSRTRRGASRPRRTGGRGGTSPAGGTTSTTARGGRPGSSRSR